MPDTAYNSVKSRKFYIEYFKRKIEELEAICQISF